MRNTYQRALHADPQIKDVLKTYTIGYKVVNGHTCAFIDDSFSIAGYIHLVADLVQKLLALKEPLFKMQAGRLVEHPCVPRVLELLKIDCDLVHAKFPACAFHPYFATFMRLAGEQNLYELAYIFRQLRGNGLMEAWPLLNAFQVALKANCRSPAFKEQMKKHKARVNKNLKSMRRYVDALLDNKYARLLVLRIDLTYGKDQPAARNWELARGHREKVIDFIKEELPRLLITKSRLASDPKAEPIPIAGYIIRTEHGASKGWHFHLMLFLDGSEFAHDFDIAKTIGKYWMRVITAGQGLYYNCNRYKTDYKSLGIGPVDWHDNRKRQALHRAVEYLCKVDYYMRPLLQGNDRSISRGEMPKVEEKKSGRQRRERPDSVPVVLGNGSIESSSRGAFEATHGGVRGSLLGLTERSKGRFGLF
jgi:hypothetical protein